MPAVNTDASSAVLLGQYELADRGGATVWRIHNVRFGLRIQPIDATVWWNRSAGVSKFSVFLGRSFNLLATALSFACE